jgi:hypothetical protein
MGRRYPDIEESPPDNGLVGPTNIVGPAVRQVNSNGLKQLLMQEAVKIFRSHFGFSSPSFVESTITIMGSVEGGGKRSYLSAGQHRATGPVKQPERHGKDKWCLAL